MPPMNMEAGKALDLLITQKVYGLQYNSIETMVPEYSTNIIVHRCGTKDWRLGCCAASVRTAIRNKIENQR